jgi:hypothetical protein
MPLDPKTQANYENADYKEMCPAWEIVRAVTGGTAKMREAAGTYLPKEPAEQEPAYRRRLNRSVFFNAFRKTVSALVGMVFQRDPVIAEDVPPEIVKQLENIDLAGTHVDVFAKELFEDAVRDGHAFILVDMEKALPLGATKADEQAAGLRPYWVRYKANQANNWRTARINGEEHLTQITFKECSYESDGEYGEKEVTRYRVFRRTVDGMVTWELYRMEKSSSGEDVLILETEGTVSLDRIPVSIVYGHRLGLMKSEPPLLDLAYLNIAHWQEYSDYRNILHVAQVPILMRKGANQDQAAVEISVASTVDVGENGDVAWVEIQGNSISAARLELVDLEQRMAMMGLSILAQRSDSNITATEVRSNQGERQSELSTMARSLKDAMEQSLEFHAQYLGLDLPGEGGSIELGVEEQALVLTPQHLQVLLSAVETNKLSLETFLTVLLNLLSESGVLPDDVVVEEEVARVKAAQQANQAAQLPTLAQKALKGAPATVSSLFAAQGQTKTNGSGAVK